MSSSKVKSKDRPPQTIDVSIDGEVIKPELKSDAETDEVDREDEEEEELDPDVDEILQAEARDAVDGDWALNNELEESERYEAKEDGMAAALVASSPRSLARFDALQAYINQARTFPLLTPEEEHELALRFHESGDLNAAKKLITSNLRLVVKIAHEYRKAYRNLLDLVQEGNMGLMHAVNKFDPYRGVRLTSYAAWWIRAYILKFILSNWRLVKIGTTQVQRKLFYNLRKEIERLESLGIENPGPKLLAERLDVPEEEVKSMQRRLANSDVSLDAPIGSGEDASTSSRIDFVVDKAERPDRATENKEFSNLLREKLLIFGQTLRGRDREIFELRTLADEPLTLQEIGDRYGITRERARQIERRMMDRLRDYLRDELGDAVDVALTQRD